MPEIKVSWNPQPPPNRQACEKRIEKVVAADQRAWSARGAIVIDVRRHEDGHWRFNLARDERLASLEWPEDLVDQALIDCRADDSPTGAS